MLLLITLFFLSLIFNLLIVYFMIVLSTYVCPTRRQKVSPITVPSWIHQQPRFDKRFLLVSVENVPFVQRTEMHFFMDG